MRFLIVVSLFGLSCHAPLWGQPLIYPHSADAEEAAEAAAAEVEATAEAAEATAAEVEQATNAADEAAIRAAMREWQTLFRSDQGSLFQVRFGDWLKVGPGTNDAQVWIKVDHSRDATVKARSSTFRFRVNCVRFQYQISSSVSHNADGNTTRYPNFAQTYVWADAIPDTIAAVLLESICD